MRSCLYNTEKIRTVGCIFNSTEASYWIFIRSIAISLYMLVGAWISLGVHVSIKPMYVDFHFLWFIFSIMPRERAQELIEAEKSYAVYMEEYSTQRGADDVSKIQGARDDI